MNRIEAFSALHIPGQPRVDRLPDASLPPPVEQAAERFAAAAATGLLVNPAAT